MIVDRILLEQQIDWLSDQFDYNDLTDEEVEHVEGLLNLLTSLLTGNLVLLKDLE